ncbi:MAG: DUF1570 domain-containing protein, partial [Asticcacaulis sp.]
MRRLWQTLTMGALLGLALPATPALADTWIRIESDNFVVHSNASARATEAYVRNLEKYRFVLHSLYRRDGDQEMVYPKLDLYFVERQSDFREVWPDVRPSVAGFVRLCSAGITGYSLFDNRAVENTRDLQDQAQNTGQTILFHEYAHMFMMQNSSTIYPSWFIEGFAEFFGTTRLNDQQALIGMAWGGRLKALQSAEKLRWEDILGETAESRNPQHRSEFYAQSWLLTHWILTDTARTQALSAFMAARAQGTDAVKAFEAAFGIPVKSLSRTLHDYLRHLKANVVTISDMPTPLMTTTTLPASADKLAIWDGGLTSCLFGKYKPEMLAKIRTEAARFPTDDYAQGVLARAELFLGDEEKSLDYFKAQIKAQPDNPDGYFHLGQAWYRMARDNRLLPGETRDSQIKKARTLFNKTYQLDPLNAVNLYHLSLTGAQGPDYPDESTLNAAYEAHMLAPSVRDFAIHAATLLLMKGHRDDARKAIAPIAGDPHGGKTAEWIASVIAAIDAGKPDADV